MHDAALLRDWIAGNTDSTFGQGRYILDAFVHQQPANELLFNGRFELGFGGWTAFEDGVPFISWQIGMPATVLDSARRRPPINILVEWYKRRPEFEINELNNVRHLAHLESRKELGDVGQALVEVLRSTPTCGLDRASIREVSLSSRITLHSLEIALTYSPAIEHVDTNI